MSLVGFDHCSDVPELVIVIRSNWLSSSPSDLRRLEPLKQVMAYEQPGYPPFFPAKNEGIFADSGYLNLFCHIQVIPRIKKVHPFLGIGV